MVKKIAEEKKVVEVKAERKYTLSVGLKDLLAAGSHLGHKVSKTNPKARENIYVAKDGIQIIDLIKTLAKLDEAANFIYRAKKSGQTVVLIGTKRQAREVVRRVAQETGVPFVTDRWLGGTVSNWPEIKKNIRRLNDIKSGTEAGKFVTYSKKDLSILHKETGRLNKMVGGLTSLEKLFEVAMVVDAGFERTAVKECMEKGIKVVAMVDTDGDPGKVDVAIPANDDNVKSITVIVEEIGKAIAAASQK